jgi:hypothetical protein
LPVQERNYYSTEDSQEEQEASPVEQPSFSRQQPLWHVAILNVLTLYGYSLIWFYKNWKDLAKFAKESEWSEFCPVNADAGAEKAFNYLRKMHLWLNTFGLMLPYVQTYFAALFFMQVAQLSPKRKFSPLSTALLLAIAVMLLLELHRLPGVFGMLFLFAAYPLVIAQDLLNAYWQSVEPSGLVIRQAFSASELVFMIIGSLGLGLALTGMVMGIGAT